MSTYDREALKAQLRIDEDDRAKLYDDATGLEIKHKPDSGVVVIIGKITGGVGHNFSDKGLSPAVRALMLEEDTDDAERDLDKNIPWWRAMPEPAQRGLMNMSFNMGWPRLSGFRDMLKALKEGRYLDAAHEAGDSKWATQVKDRAKRIQALFKAAAGATKPGGSALSS